MIHSLKKDSKSSGYRYRDYLICKVSSGKWDISESVFRAGWGTHAGFTEWEVCDTRPTLRECMDTIDEWNSDY